jgi:glycosyltransferase involved in cell wall biosynthesis
MGLPRVLVVHNRYRFEGGEERSVELHVSALAAAGVPHSLLERRSSDSSRAGAARALLSGGSRPDELAGAARALGASVVHFHNTLPLVGPRGLARAREAGAGVVVHLHNLRLFCAIGVAARDGGPCFRCHHRFTLPGLVLNCRGSLPEAAVYATALALHQPTVIDAVDSFVVPSRYAAGQVTKLGLPRERVEVLPHYLPAGAFAERSRAGEGTYALVVARLSPEKGVDTAIDAAALAGVPLRVAGEGPAAGELAARIAARGAPVELLGRLGREALRQELDGAAMLLMPSRYHEFAGYSALEAMAAGVPVVASALGAPPEMLGSERCVAPNDPAGLAARMRELWEQRELRAAEGELLVARARAAHGEQSFTRALLELYGRVATAAGRRRAE